MNLDYWIGKFMKKFLIITGIVFVLLMVGFSGCNDKEKLVDINKIELVSYDVQSIGYSVYDKREGFQYFEQLYKYDVTGIIKNVGSNIINKVQITALFIDENESIIGLDEVYVEDIEVEDIKSFNVEFKDKENLEYVKDIKFEFNIV